MYFLFGLDMLKRHRCKIDLERSALVFCLPDGQSMLEKILEEKRGDNDGQNGDPKEEEETLGKDKGIGQHLNTHF